MLTFVGKHKLWINKWRRIQQLARAQIWPIYPWPTLTAYLSLRLTSDRVRCFPKSPSYWLISSSWWLIPRNLQVHVSCWVLRLEVERETGQQTHQEVGCSVGFIRFCVRFLKTFNIFLFYSPPEILSVSLTYSSNMFIDFESKVSSLWTPSKLVTR